MFHVQSLYCCTTSQTIEFSRILYFLNISQGIRLCQDYTNIFGRAKKDVIVLQALLFESFLNWIDNKDGLYKKDDLHKRKKCGGR